MRSSVKAKAANDNLDKELIWWTREVWQPRLGFDLNQYEAGQIAANVTGFFSVLAEWARAEVPAPANDNEGDAASDDCGGHNDR